MINKKSLLIIVFLLIYALYGYALSLLDLTKFVLESNPDINSASTIYEKQILLRKGLDGAYSPTLVANSSSKISKDYNWDNIPDFFSSNIVYTQPIPGGTSFSVETNYIFNVGSIDEYRYMSQSPNVAFTLSQSLLPFWIQGKIKDPLILSYEQQEEYYYYQFLYTKKNVLIQLLQNYVSNQIVLNEIQINQNSIDFYEEQIESLKELKEQGNISQSKILEIENSKWTAQQNLMLAQSNSAGYIQNLKTLCAKDFNENLLESSILKGYENKISKILDDIMDPLIRIYELKIQMLDSNRILEKQSSAPILNISINPEWNLDTVKQEDWKTVWKEKKEPNNWTFSVGVNFSPMFNSFAKKDYKKFQLEYDDAQLAYNAYLRQKEFIKKQYSILLEKYMKQNENISILYNSGLMELKDYEYQYKTGAVSKLDYDSVRIRVANCALSKANIELYVWLYSILFHLCK